jgi:hypothetical protein
VKSRDAGRFVGPEPISFFSTCSATLFGGSFVQCSLLKRDRGGATPPEKPEWQVIRWATFIRLLSATTAPGLSPPPGREQWSHSFPHPSRELPSDGFFASSRARTGAAIPLKLLRKLRWNGLGPPVVAWLEYMTVPSHIYTPVTPRNGGEVHATSLNEPGRTVCGHKFRGWVIRPSRLTCQRCKEMLIHPVQPDTKGNAR